MPESRGPVVTQGNNRDIRNLSTSNAEEHKITYLPDPQGLEGTLISM